MWKEFFKQLDHLRQSGELFVVGTVVQVSGSTYRRPGARVLITADGSATGLISGGCFESELIEKAKRTIKERKPITVMFDTTSADDIVFGLGLGCTGVAKILLEPLQGAGEQEHLDFIRRCIFEIKPGVVTTVFRAEGNSPLHVGDHALLSSLNLTFENSASPHASILLDAARSVLSEKRSRTQKFDFEDGSAEVLLEWITLPVPLVIFGGGPDAVPLVRFAHQLGWNVTVVDRRPAFARPDRFAEADRVVLCEPADLSKNVPIDAASAAIVMTHNFETDLQFLKEILCSKAGYIGLLGPQAKGNLLLQKLREENFEPTKGQLERLYNPVGLDIGAETPEEIALSIIAEIQNVRMGRSATSLRRRSGPIHDI